MQRKDEYLDDRKRLRGSKQTKLIKEGKMPKNSWDELQKDKRRQKIRKMTERASDRNDKAFRRLSYD